MLVYVYKNPREVKGKRVRGNERAVRSERGFNYSVITTATGDCSADWLLRSSCLFAPCVFLLLFSSLLRWLGGSVQVRLRYGRSCIVTDHTHTHRVISVIGFFVKSC